MKTIVITSTYSNPLHPGHVECFNLAKELGDELWVIVHNDHQARLKRGTESFQDERFRMDLVGNLKSVDRVFLSVDTDASVVESIREVVAQARKEYADVTLMFAKGGDRIASNIPEAAVLEELNIPIVDRLGVKTHHSSEYAKKASHTAPTTVHSTPLETGERPWGSYYVLADYPGYKVKRIVVKPASRLSLQSHEHRAETWVCVRGVATAEIDGVIQKLSPGESCRVPQGAQHRLSNTHERETIEIVEVQWGTYTGEDDIVRYEDDYNRAS